MRNLPTTLKSKVRICQQIIDFFQMVAIFFKSTNFLKTVQRIFNIWPNFQRFSQFLEFLPTFTFSDFFAKSHQNQKFFWFVDFQVGGGGNGLLVSSLTFECFNFSPHLQSSFTSRSTNRTNNIPTNDET